MWNIILNIIYFLLSLTVLVSIHEAGHLSMAKLFGVYCQEYSIGFGPAIFTKKPQGVNKKGQPRETAFSIRCIPLGGYVSMAGEGMEDVEELKAIPANRFLQGVAKWKRAIIMVAGVTLNAILGLVLLISAFTIIQRVDYRSCSFDITEKLSYTDYENNTKEYTSPMVDLGFTEDTVFTNIVVSYDGAIKDYLEADHVIDETAGTSGTEASTYDYTITPGTLKEEGGTYAFMTSRGNEFLPMDVNDTKTYTFTTSDGQVKTYTTHAYISAQEKALNQETNEEVVTNTYAWELIGISLQYRHYTFGEVLGQSFKTFGQYAIAIYTALAKLFTKGGFSALGGPVAIVQQQMTFVNMGFGYYLLFWGLISINLAVINLLPFPGLDGWHLLVCVIEGITKKEINPKVKSVMSAIGLILLFGLMIAITIKDVIGLFI